MKLLVVRHATAVERGTPGIPDDERPLTPAGARRFRKAARGLAAIVPRPDLLLTSPLPRARRTAELAAAAWKRVEIREVAALASGDFDGLAAALADCPANSHVAIFGHEPHLSALLARLLGGSRDACLTFKKGGVALVELAGPLADGGSLVFFIPPRVLRRLAD